MEIEMNISTSTPAIFKEEKPVFLQNQVTKQKQEKTNRLAELLEGKLDKASISPEAEELLQKLREEKEVAQAETTGNEQASTILQLAQQSLQDLSKDIDMQLQNVAILESETATVEEKAAARENIGYLESTANVRGGIFTEQLLQKVAPNASSAVQAAMQEANINASVAANSKQLLKTDAKSLSFDNIQDKTPAEMREILTAAKEKLQQMAQAIGDVSKTLQTPNSKLDVVKEDEKRTITSQLDDQALEQLLQSLLNK